MPRLPKSAVAATLAAMLASALAVPAGAADPQGTLAIVNGIPGTKTDICLNGKELRSNVPYGGAVLRSIVPVGGKTLKVFKADPRTCKGSLLAKHAFAVTAGIDLTLVATKKAPKVIVFDNAGFGEIPPIGAPVGVSIVVIRDAVEPPVNVHFRYWSPEPEVPLDPAANAPWGKGDQTWVIVPEDFAVQVRVTRLEHPDTIAGTRFFSGTSSRHERIVVGTTLANLRIVKIDRAIAAPSP